MCENSIIIANRAPAAGCGGALLFGLLVLQVPFDCVDRLGFDRLSHRSRLRERKDDLTVFDEQHMITININGFLDYDEMIRIVNNIYYR